MGRFIWRSIWPFAALGLLAACAAPDSSDQAGGPTFIQLPADGQSLVGATPQLLSAAFGKPVLLRQDGAAQVWLYQQGGCGLNLILYPDNAGTPRVAMAAPTVDGADLASCSASLERAHLAGLAQPTAALAPATILPAASIPAAPPPGQPPESPAGAGLERSTSS